MIPVSGSQSRQLQPSETQHSAIVRGETLALKEKIISPAQLAHLLSQETRMGHSTDTTDPQLFLRVLSYARRDQWSESTMERRCQAGEVIFREGEPGNVMFMILAGRVAILKGELTTPTILAFRGVGEIFGEMALLENQPRSATVVSLDDTHLLGINRQNFQELLNQNPSVGLSIMETLSSRLRKTNEALSTGDLSEKKLINQVSALQDENQRLEELQRLQQETSELIIHDLRNPLSAIAVSLKMLSMTLPVEILQANSQLLQISQHGVERLQRLVDTLLEVSRLEAGEAEFRTSQIDLGKMILDIVDQISTLDRKGIVIQLRIDPELPPVPGDREVLERVLTNLVDNALKFTPDQGTLTFEARRLPGEVAVSVMDSGPGISQIDRQRIFERFTQASGEQRQRRGFGLGLTYCRLAVEKHGGRIWVEPGEGNTGSRFTFTLPL